MSRNKIKLLEQSDYADLGGSLSVEQIQDLVATMLLDGAIFGASITYDDIGGTIGIEVTPAYIAAMDYSGWIPIADTWTYASANTINVSAGAHLTFQKGMAIRFKQGGGYKYYNLSAVASTLLTVFINTDYTVANSAITDMAYSFFPAPFGFPGSFTLAAPTWTTTGTAFTNQPGTNTFKYSVEGSFISVGGSAITNGTSGGTGEFIATWAAGSIPVPDPYGQSGVANGLSSGSKGFCFVLSTGNAVRMGKYDNTALAANSQQFSFSIRYKF